MTRQEAKDAIALLITDPENEQNTPEKVREALSIIIDSSVNTQDGQYISPKENIPEIGFGGAVILDCSLSKNFFIQVTEDLEMDVINVQDGETYTILFEQASNSSTVGFRPAFKFNPAFEMPAGDGNSALVTAYGHSESLYCQPQVDLS